MTILPVERAQRERQEGSPEGGGKACRRRQEMSPDGRRISEKKVETKHLNGYDEKVYYYYTLVHRGAAMTE